MWLGRLALLAVAFGLLRWWFGHRPAAEHPVPRWWLVTAGVVGLGIVASPALAGHSAAGDYRLLAALTSTVHVGAMAIWLGGLVLMGAVAVRGPDLDAQRGVVARFSRIAMWCVLALIATGAFQTWREVRTLDGLRDTDFGRILVVKVVVFAVMVLFAVFSRDFVRRIYPRYAVVSGGAVDLLDDEWTAEDEERERRREWRQPAAVGLGRGRARAGGARGNRGARQRDPVGHRGEPEWRRRGGDAALTPGGGRRHGEPGAGRPQRHPREHVQSGRGTARRPRGDGDLRPAESWHRADHGAAAGPRSRALPVARLRPPAFR